MPFVSAILLAAGESTRMGRQKALLPWEGTTLLEYQLDAASRVDDISEIIVVTGHEPDRITEITAMYPRAQVAHNTAYETGKVSSIKAGLAAVAPDADAILLLSVDQPRSSAILRAVVRCSHATPRRNHGAGHAKAVAGTRSCSMRACARNWWRSTRRRRAFAPSSSVMRPMCARWRSTIRPIHLDLNRPEDLERAR